MGHSLISSKGSFMCTFITPVIEHWLKQEIAQWVHHEGSIRRPIAPQTDTTMELYLTACCWKQFYLGGKTHKKPLAEYSLGLGNVH